MVGVSPKRNKAFFSLENGDHLFEVRARDLDVNEDPTPARARFEVVPPVWMQPWFVSLMVVLTLAIALQTGRVVRHGLATGASPVCPRDSGSIGYWSSKTGTTAGASWFS